VALEKESSSQWGVDMKISKLIKKKRFWGTIVIAALILWSINSPEIYTGKLIFAIVFIAIGLKLAYKKLQSFWILL
jgi:hypothetical protein